MTLNSPIDAHVHFRQGAALLAAVPYTAATFAGAVAMPNTEPPLRAVTQVLDYRLTSRAAAYGTDPNFQIYPTLYFDPDVEESTLRAAVDNVAAVKFYPQGLTTNSDHGCDPFDVRIGRVLEVMQDLGLVLSVHPESPGYHEDRELLFAHVARLWAQRFPRLRIVLEHVSHWRTVHLLSRFENLYATVTPHHLLLTGDDVVGPPFRPHRFCAPVPKRPEDREALRQLVLYAPADVFRKVMLGTDSAPHPVAHKESAECCAGVFTAPVALQLIASLFLDGDDPSVSRFQAFVSDHARAFYGLNPAPKAVTLVRRPFVVPEWYGDVVPLAAGETLSWSVDRVEPVVRVETDDGDG